MSIAVITIYCNESFRLKKWREYYDEYADEVDLHIIIDNNSDINETRKMKDAFPDSKVISLPNNGGVTAAYNAGIMYAQNIEGIDAVAFVGNDIRIEKGGLYRLYRFLFSDEKLGEVSPILLAKDSDVIEDNGDYFSSVLIMNEYDLQQHISSDTVSHISDGLPGAMNMAKIDMYRNIGLLDEVLFMYSDEVDIGIRAKRAGYLMSSFVGVKAWHQHENINGGQYRQPFSNYLVIRNKVYLAKKHYGLRKKVHVFFYFTVTYLYSYFKALIQRNKERKNRAAWSLIGAWNGLIGNMKPNKYSMPYGSEYKNEK